jgi:hypothetical protein
VSWEKPRNLAASVRQRLFNLAQERREDFGLVLTRYGLERFLYRLSQSQYREQFILKGALLFELWTHRPYRPTRDLDLEGQPFRLMVSVGQQFANRSDARPSVGDPHDFVWVIEPMLPRPAGPHARHGRSRVHQHAM